MEEFKRHLKGNAAGAPLIMGDVNTRKAAVTPTEEITPEEMKKLKFLVAQGKARDFLMTGPRAQSPTGRAVRKAARRILKGLPIKGSWRGWPHEGEVA